MDPFRAVSTASQNASLRAQLTASTPAAGTLTPLSWTRLLHFISPATASIRALSSPYSYSSIRFKHLKCRRKLKLHPSARVAVGMPKSPRSKGGHFSTAPGSGRSSSSRRGTAALPQPQLRPRLAGGSAHRDPLPSPLLSSPSAALTARGRLSAKQHLGFPTAAEYFRFFFFFFLILSYFHILLLPC